MIVYSVRGVPAKKKRPDIRLMGSAEIRVALGGVSRERVYQITQRRTFPAPLAELAMGNVWWADDVEEWIAANRPQIAEDPEA